MKTDVIIQLKSGKVITIADMNYISYPNSTQPTKIESFENFYLFDNLLYFKGKSSSVTLNSTDIEYVLFQEMD